MVPSPTTTKIPLSRSCAAKRMQWKDLCCIPRPGYKHLGLGFLRIWMHPAVGNSKIDVWRGSHEEEWCLADPNSLRTTAKVSGMARKELSYSQGTSKASCVPPSPAVVATPRGLDIIEQRQDYQVPGLCQNFRHT